MNILRGIGIAIVAVTLLWTSSLTSIQAATEETNTLLNANPASEIAEALGASVTSDAGNVDRIVPVDENGFANNEGETDRKMMTITILSLVASLALGGLALRFYIKS